MIAAALLICLAPAQVDGDTIRCGPGPARIRLFGIQAPERGEPGYAESGANLARHISGGLVCTTVGASYNRIVAQCFNAAGQDVGRMQLDGGFAVEWCSYSVSRAYPNGLYGRC